MKKTLLISFTGIITAIGYAQVPNANESSFPSEGSIPEGTWGTYFLQGLTSERTLRMGVVNDGFTRAEIELENNNTKSGKIIFKTTANSAGAEERMVILNNGKVGIGTTAPEEMLDVEGNLRLGGSGGTLISPRLFVTDLNPGATGEAAGIRGRNMGHFVVDIYGNDAKDAFAVRTDRNYDGTLDHIPFVVNNAGRVGINTTNPDAELSVNGHIHTKEVKVDLDGWSDFVFEEGYDLPTLQEVEAHIRENGHLQDIPAAKEVAENGIRIGEMNAKLLQKIEELMLYTIAQEKRIQRLESEIVQLKKQ
ncbi:hypothetical protein SAMN02927921_00604 [Sinomicrobium oceani]|uniref:Chaperone of endosialidase n=1 Tax=Sinomicrobium oceani TaxID=1150368 RepID=A0A1K1ME96_9FLAO|nr:hypothetical protein [Sinomicrobium oceani]SFW21425.1 hypothetical protein SAMN02927921_00604 [Sinomicrobium oceani]